MNVSCFIQPCFIPVDLESGDQDVSGCDWMNGLGLRGSTIDGMAIELIDCLTNLRTERRRGGLIADCASEKGWCYLVCWLKGNARLARGKGGDNGGGGIRLVRD
jgi:hypothetical protein